MSLIFSLLSPSAVLFVVLSFIVIHFLRNRKSNSLFGKIPQPSGKLPVLGHSLLLLKKGVHITESSFEAFYKYAAEFREHGLYGLQLAVQPIVHIFAANHFEKLLTSTKHINKSTGYYSLLPWLGSGLIVSGGEKWHKDRKMLTPIQSVDQQTCVVLSSCALDTICETSMGVNLQTQTSGENTFSKSFIEFSKLATKRSLNTLLNSSDLLYGLTSNGRKSNLMIKNMHEFTSKFIKKRKNDVESLNIRTNDPAKKKLMSLLDLMLDIHLSGNGFNLKDIQFQLDLLATILYRTQLDLF